MMPVTLYMTRDGMRLSPAHPLDAEKLGAIPSGRELKVVVSQTRSRGQHNLYWMVLTISFDMIPDPPPGAHWPFHDVESLHRHLKEEMGYVRRIKTLSGEERWVPVSTSWRAMDQIKFSQFFNDAMDYLSRHVWGGMSLDEMLLEVESRYAGETPFYEVIVKRRDAEGKPVSGAWALLNCIPKGGGMLVRRVMDSRGLKGVDFSGLVGEQFPGVQEIIHSFEERIKTMMERKNEKHT